MANDTSVEWGDAISKMNPVDFVRSGSLLVAFLACGFSDRRGQGSTWLRADQIASVAFGATFLLFPHTLLTYLMVGKADWIHVALMQMVGFSLLACSATWWMSSRSREATAAWSISRVLSFVILLQVLYVSEIKYAKHNQRLTSQHHTFGTFGAILGFIGHLLCAFRVYGSVNERNIPREWTREAACLLFLICFLVIDIFMMLAHPQDMQQFFSFKGWKMDGVHVYLMRVGCTQMMSLLFFGASALLHLAKHDKVAVLMSSLMFYGTMFPMIVYYQWKHPFINPDYAKYTWISMGSVVGVTAFGAYRDLTIEF